jgi:hypothetical protein
MSMANATLKLGDRTYLAEMPEQPVCDFCSAPLDTTARCFLSVGTSVEMRDEGKARLTINSDAHWIACATCAPMVERRDRVGVLARSYERLVAAHGEMAPEKETLAYVQESMFWQHFTGEEHPASEHPSEQSI